MVASGASLYRSLTLEENIVVVITQGKVIDDNVKTFWHRHFV